MAKPEECCICGDVGFAKDLLLCSNCNYRFQHTYCSRLYPNIDLNDWTCEWCLHEKVQQKNATATDLSRRKAALIAPDRRNAAFECLLQIAQTLPDQNIPTGPEGREFTNGSYTKGKRVNWRREPGDELASTDGWNEAKKESNYARREDEILGLQYRNCRQHGRCKYQQVPRKQRCNLFPDKKKSTRQFDRWRNLGSSKVHCNASKAIGRRYKLLADVLC